MVRTAEPSCYYFRFTSSKGMWFRLSQVVCNAHEPGNMCGRGVCANPGVCIKQVILVRLARDHLVCLRVPHVFDSLHPESEYKR